MDRIVWEGFVRDAEDRDDRDALAALFAEAERAWGHAEAARIWWQVLSAGDGGAVTG